MEIVRCICLIVFFLTLCNADTDLEASMVADVIRAMEKPSAVIATLCWPAYKKLQLYSALVDVNATQQSFVQFVKFSYIHKKRSRDQHILFLMDLNCPDVSNYIEKMGKEKYFRSPFRWLFIDSSEDNVTSNDAVLQITDIIDILPDSEVMVARNIESNYVISFRVEYQRKILQNRGEMAPFRWLFIDSSEDNVTSNDAVLQITDIIDILPDSEVMVARNIESNYVISFIYRIGAGNSWHTESFGVWNATTKFVKVENFTETTSLRRLNLEGYEISICYVCTDNDSINHLTDDVNDHIDTITKVNFPTTNHLLDFLNASRKYIFANTWGYRVNGTWNGMTGHLVREEVEIGGSPMFLTSERISVVEYISSPTPTRSKFVFQQPKLSYESNLFLLSFKNTVWYSSLALVNLLLLAIFVVAVWEWKKNKEQFGDRHKDSGVLRANLPDIVMLIVGAACQQGSTVELKGSLGRIVMLILFLALMFLYTSYSANIVALLQSSSSKIKTLEDLLNSRMKFGVHDTVYNRYYFTTATEPIRKAIYEKKVAPPGVSPRFMSMEEGVKRMQKGLFAFQMEIGVGYKFVGKYFKESEKCNLKEIQYLQVIDPFLAVRRDTAYKEMFKIGFKRIQEHGLQTRENLLLYEKRPKCSGSTSNFISVSMVDCYPALLVLSYGILISLGMLIIEILFHRREIISKKIACNHREQKVNNSAY